MQVVVTKCDANGNVDVDDIRAKAEKYSDRLAALMITYPSTHGVFEEDIVAICEIVHAHGGQVYTDGANMNALVGVAKPGKWGSDVSHLNLHKTFCIPHGGGGPGVGPCAVKSHLAPFLPRTLAGSARRRRRHGQRRELRLGSILPISWMYITLMGTQGLRKATAGRAAQRQLHRQETRAALRDAVHRPQRPGRARVHPRPAPAQGRHRHRRRGRGQAPDRLRLPRPDAELPGRRHADGGADRERIAARARPLHRRDDPDPRRDPRDRATAALDREDNPLKHAPHTATMVAASEWTHAYPRELAAFPLAALQQQKYWPPVARVDNVYGDKNVFCSCVPIEAFAGEIEAFSEPNVA